MAGFNQFAKSVGIANRFGVTARCLHKNVAHTMTVQVETVLFGLVYRRVTPDIHPDTGTISYAGRLGKRASLSAGVERNKECHESGRYKNAADVHLMKLLSSY